jgi:hypothetical protein
MYVDRHTCAYLHVALCVERRIERGGILDEYQAIGWLDYVVYKLSLSRKEGGKERFHNSKGHGMQRPCTDRAT